jgi:hypothetical protein
MESPTSSDAEMLDDYASLTSEAGEYVFENGRRYHGYKAGSKSTSMVDQPIYLTLCRVFLA